MVTRAPVSTCTPISVSMSCTASPHRWHRHSRAAWRRVAAMPPLSTPLLATTMQNGLGEEKFFHCRWVLAQKFKLTGSWAKAAAGSFFLGGVVVAPLLLQVLPSPAPRSYGCSALSLVPGRGGFQTLFTNPKQWNDMPHTTQGRIVRIPMGYLYTHIHIYIHIIFLLGPIWALVPADQAPPRPLPLPHTIPRVGPQAWDWALVG